MKIQHSSRCRNRPDGFSLIEVTFCLVQAMALAGTVILMLSQRTAFLRIVNQFTFLREEAPAMNVLLGRILRQADAYRIFPSKSAAISGIGAVNTDGTAVWLRFRNPDDSFEQAMIAFETSTGQEGLNFYHYDGAAWESEPAWTISSMPQNVRFANDSGVLLITVTGRNGEEITYVGSPE